MLLSSFNWCSIPSGEIYLEAGGYVPAGGKAFPVSEFEIAEYPITNAQFAPFLADGYENSRYWSDEAWGWKHKRGWKHPRYWLDADFSASQQSLVGVSWYEAEAYCTWLSAVSATNINLATEQEWQFAAQGQTGWSYPWGNEFDNKKCNNRTSFALRPSSVFAYPDNESIFGVHDLSGNIWEWTRTSYFLGNQKGIRTNNFVMRGGSFLDYPNSNRLRLNYRTSAYAQVSSLNLGFRIVRSI